MNWGVITLLNLLACVGITTYIVSKVANLKTFTPPSESVEGQLYINRERAGFLRDVYINVYRTLNTNAAFNVLSDLLFHSVYSDIQLLRKFGVRREITFVPRHTTNEEENFSMTTVSYGSLSFTNATDVGEYRERLIDTATEQVLFEQHYKHAWFEMRFNRNPGRSGAQQVYCAGCGTQLNVNGELFICPNCNNTYTADSYDWMMTSVEIEEVSIAGNTINRDAKNGKLSKEDKQSKIMNGFMVVTMLLGFIASKNSFVVFLSIVCNFGILWVFGNQILDTIKVNKPYQQLVNFDPFCHPERVAERANYLVKQLYLDREIDPGRARPFMSEQCFRQWKDALVYNENHILSTKPYFYSQAINKFWTDSQRQYVRVIAPVQVTILNGSRQIQQYQEIAALVLSRNINARYPNVKSAEIFTCKGCGMSINMTADARCKYCGTAYDVGDFDWVIHEFCKPEDVAPKKKLRELLGK